MAPPLGFKGSWLLLGLISATVGIVPPSWGQRSVQEIAQIAQQVTVQVNDSRDNGGSGVLIDRETDPISGDYLYQALTAHHVVQGESLTFEVQTPSGQTFEVIEVQPLLATAADLDLAVVVFSTPQELPMAEVGDSNAVTVGSSVYVVGYPALPGQTGADRNLEFSPGVITSRLRTPQTGGYSLRYNAVTRGGMSGGPVFDQKGQVIGIHGQGDIAGAVQTASGDVEVLKTGFNAAIPSQSFAAQFNPPTTAQIPITPETDPPTTARIPTAPETDPLQAVAIVPSSPALGRPEPAPEAMGSGVAVPNSIPAEDLLSKAFIGELKPYGIPFQDVLCQQTLSSTQRARIAQKVADAGIAATLVSPTQVNESYLSTLSSGLRIHCRQYSRFGS